MPRMTTKPTAKQRPPAATPSGLSLPPDAPDEAVVSPDDGDVALRVATSEPGPAGPVAILGPEDHGPTGGLVYAFVVDDPAPEAKLSHYEVVHAAVGAHYKGELVEVGIFADEQVWRLLATGAIIPFIPRREPWN